MIPDRMESGDQVGLDLFYTSGLTRGLPAMIPVAMLYSTPEDAAAADRLFEEARISISYIEMGEEPDGSTLRRKTTQPCICNGRPRCIRLIPTLNSAGPSLKE